MKKNKVIIFTIIGVLIGLLVVGGIAYAFRSKPVEEEVTQKKKKVTLPENVIPYEERPYVVMAPTLGREVDVTIYTLPKVANGVEYLAEYQYGTSLGGNEQFIDLSDLPANKQFALYSRSAGGKTSYEEDVKGGSLIMDFDSDQPYRLNQPWVYIDNKDKADKFVTKDGTFQVSGKLAAVKYAILYNSPGLPAVLPTTRISEIYTVALTSKVSALTVTFPKVSTGTIYGWDGSTWEKLETQASSDGVTSKGELFEAYVVGE